MQNIYVDESGTMTLDSGNNWHRYFIMTLVHVSPGCEKKLNKNFKRFIGNQFNTIEQIDTKGKMIKDGKFLELKGSSVTYDFKNDFVKYLCKNNYFKIYYIVIDNFNLKDNTKFYESKARAINYVFKLAFRYHLIGGKLPYDEYHIKMDEQNVKVEARKSLEDYLNSEIYLGEGLSNKIKVSYCDSCNDSFVQIADMFSNIYYSHLHCLMNDNNKYESILNYMNSNGYLARKFIFPKI